MPGPSLEANQCPVPSEGRLCFNVPRAAVASAGRQPKLSGKASLARLELSDRGNPQLRRRPTPRDALAPTNLG